MNFQAAHFSNGYTAGLLLLVMGFEFGSKPIF
jgi:hypothetical protein